MTHTLVAQQLTSGSSLLEESIRGGPTALLFATWPSCQASAFDASRPAAVDRQVPSTGWSGVTSQPPPTDSRGGGNAWISSPGDGIGGLYHWAAASLLRVETSHATSIHRPGRPGDPAPTDPIAAATGASREPRRGVRGPGESTSGSTTKGAVVTYLIVGLDRKTHARWHGNVSADDVGTAKSIARGRASTQGIDLVVAAVIGPNSAVVSDPAEERAATARAA